MQVQQFEASEQEIHLRDYFHVIKKRQRVIGLFAAITLTIVMLGSFAATPMYVAETRVLIEKNSDNDLASARSMYNFYDPQFQQTQFEIIKSNNVTSRVVERLKLDTKYRSFFLKDAEVGFITATLRGLKKSIKDILHIEKKSVVGATNIELPQTTEADIIAKIIQANLATQPLPETKIVSVSYRDPNPIMSAMVVNALVESYMDEMLEIKMHSSNYTLQWMTSKADEEKKKLEKSENLLQQYRRNQDLITVENKLVVIPERLAEYSSQLSKARSQRNELEEIYNLTRAAGNNFDAIESTPIFAANKTLQSIRDQIMTAEQKIVELSKKYGHKHPLMIKAVGDREVLAKEKDREIQRIIDTNENEYKLAKSKESNIEKLLTETKQEMLNISERMIQYNIMQREVETNRILYDSLIKSIKGHSATEQLQPVNIWVVKKAQIPETYSTPNKKRSILLGLILGLFGGIGCAFFIEYLDNTVKSGDEVERRFNLPVLGIVSQLDDANDKHIETIIKNEPRSPVVESYKTIRSSIMLSSPDHPPKTLLVTSVQPQEGKTTTAVNIARTLAMAHDKVLIIDCDLRKPRLHTVMNLGNQTGLSSYLTGTTNCEIANRIEDENLTIITSGPIPPNPSELLGSERMSGLIKELGKKFDYIILDTPPILSVTDTMVLSRIVEGVIMVSRAGVTIYEMLGRGLKMLAAVHAPLLGIIINGMSEKISTDYYYGRYYRQHEPAPAEDSNQAKSA